MCGGGKGQDLFLCVFYLLYTPNIGHKKKLIRK